MKKINSRLIPVLELAAGAVCGLTAYKLWSLRPAWIPGALASVALALLLIGSGRFIGQSDEANWTPERRREQALEEGDERSLAIREKAALPARRWTGWMLAALEAVALCRGDVLYGVLLVIAILLHHVFYVYQVDRWNRKL